MNAYKEVTSQLAVTMFVMELDRYKASIYRVYIDCVCIYIYIYIYICVCVCLIDKTLQMSVVGTVRVY